jgi:hypothetical protein
MLHFFLLTLILGSTMLAHTSQEQPLEFILSTEQSTYFAYEPLVLNMAVINNGQRPVQGDFNFLDFEFQELKLFYRKKGGEFKRYNNLVTWLAMGANYMPGKGPKPILEPGGQRSTEELIFFDRLPALNEEGKFVFDEPGEYEFKASFQYIFKDPSKVVESNVLHVTVVNPAEEEREALAWWKDKDLALVVQGDSLDPEAVRKLRAFLQKFRTSLYAKAVRDTSNRLKGYLARKAQKKKLTEDEKELYELLRSNK